MVSHNTDNGGFYGIGFRMESPESESLFDEKEVLFSVKLLYQKDLDDGNLSREFRMAFKEKNRLLSQYNITVSTGVRDSEWLITDKGNNQRYRVRKDGQKLDIYERSESIHDFYHTQLIQSFGNSPFDRKVQVECPSWLPVSQPSFPLTANCPITLVFSLLLTLYGKRYCWEFFHNHNPQLNDLKQQMNKLDEWIKWTSRVD